MLVKIIYTGKILGCLENSFQNKHIWRTLESFLRGKLHIVLVDKIRTILIFIVEWVASALKKMRALKMLQKWSITEGIRTWKFPEIQNPGHRG